MNKTHKILSVIVSFSFSALFAQESTPAVEANQVSTPAAEIVVPAPAVIDSVKPSDNATAVADTATAEATSTAPAITAVPVVDSANVSIPAAEVANPTPTAVDSTKTDSTNAALITEAKAVIDTTPVVDSNLIIATDSSNISTKPVVNITQIADSAKGNFVADTVLPKLTGTPISGELSGFLKADKSPYLATGDVTVSPNTVLVIDAGTTILFDAGTSFKVNHAQLVIAGSANSPVIFKSSSAVPQKGEWKGITVVGENHSEIRNLQVHNAAVGIAIENSDVSVQNTSVKGTTIRGFYARNSKISLRESAFEENQVALQIDNYTEANIERCTFEKNKVALLSSPLSKTDLSSSYLTSNEVGVIDMGNTIVNYNNTSVQQNEVGLSSKDIIQENAKESILNNKKNFNNEAIAAEAILPPAPEIQGTEKRQFVASDRVYDIFNQKVEADSTQKTWSIFGNVTLGGNYHYVRMRKYHGSEDFIIGTDTVSDGNRYKNYFQVPGFGGNFNAFLLMQSINGTTIEFNADLTSDSWNHISPNPVTLRYKDNYNQLALGDIQLSGGETYMSGLPIFGGEYALSLLKNNADEPLITFDGFFGEAKRSLVPDERHPYLYNEYIDNGEAQAQRIAYGGFFKWAPIRRFDAKIGAIYANDEIEDPIIRKGAQTQTITSDPLQESLTMFADGNWLFFPGDIELNGQIAVGRADTTDVIRERAINKVFAKADVNSSSYSLLRTLMQNESRIDRLTSKELEEIFGDNTSMTKKQMIEQLHSLIKEAKKVQKSEEKDRDDDRVLGQNWGSQNFAFAASLNWNFYKTHIEGHFKYVGEDYYSAGSPDQLSDTREFGVLFEQNILDVWSVGLNYQINVENAANGNKKNLFGLGEGTYWGFSSDEDSEWFKDHELDNNRAKYIQNAGIENTFNIGSKVVLSAGYNIEYRTQYRPTQLHANIILSDEIYRDNYFKPTKNTSITIDSTEVDKERWNQYLDLYDEPFIASKFEEKLLKQSISAGLSVKALKSVFNFNGRWTIRSDKSEFHNDSLIKDFDFADSTWEKLGYYFGSPNYFEHSYPISITTTLNKVQNRIAATPRLKSYKRNDMNEFEISVEDNLEISFANKFFILGLNGQFRYMITEWEELNKTQDESETDVLGDVNFRFNLTKHFFTELYTGAAFYYRPEYLSNEYKDIYAGINLNFIF